MNLRLLASSLIILAGAPLVVAQTEAPSNPPPAAGHPGGDDDTTELGDHMHKVAKAFKTLRKQLSDPSQNDSSLALVATMHDNLEAGLLLKPAKEADLPADQQAAFQAKFEDSLKSFIGEVDKLSALIKAGDNAGAVAQAQKLGQLERQDHKEFRKPKKD